MCLRTSVKDQPTLNDAYARKLRDVIAAMKIMSETGLLQPLALDHLELRRVVTLMSIETKNRYPGARQCLVRMERGKLTRLDRFIIRSDLIPALKQYIRT